MEKARDNPYVRTAVAIGAGFYGGFGLAGAYGWGATGAGFAGGFIAGGIASGNLRGAAYGGVSGGAFGFVGDMGLTGWNQVGAHAFTGGISSSVAGGDFRSGFIGAGFGAFASPAVNLIPGNGSGAVMARVMAAGMIGGASASLAGGDFGNGFATAAFGRLFNHEGPGHQYKTKEVDGRTYTLRYHQCANTDCLLYGANLDTSAPGTQAYLQAVEGQGLRDLGTAASVVSFVSPLSAAGRIATFVSLSTDIASVTVFNDHSAAASLMIGESAKISAEGFGTSAGPASRIGAGSSLIFDYLNNR